MRTIIISLFIGVIIGVVGTLYFRKPDIKKEEVIVEKEKLITQEKVVTVVKEIKKPDGTTITETVKTEDKSTQKNIEMHEKKLDFSYKKNYIIEYNRAINDGTNSLIIYKNVINNIFVGVGYNEKSGAVVGLAISF
ncbi:MAG: hypothetical protein RML94_01775 [Bacteroidia bacterium]|nr:hypothetical protein [Bacteroidia bacterium]